ncbi:hypothetical protein PAXINDRAFT_157058 [Paxillus involutus ATCC 200175]|uniref:Uncharacterized protein n=1 Tax=Paxillus involutus ATCC 200175 TaxID=664439 RepID=A0A0C9T8U6_PAXIN|nr:hypothetical protein PAXINDRAFT_157058 [Paxillus involutus ATCC 200175]
MPSSVTASVPPASPRCQIVLEAQMKKCTSAEKQADDQRTSTMLILTELTLYFLNHTWNIRTNKKASLAGKINNWASLVEASLKGGSLQGPGSTLVQSTSTNSNVPLPSTQTRTTSSIHTKVTTFHPIPDVNVAGGFDDNEQDDSQERESAMQSNLKQGQTGTLKHKCAVVNKGYVTSSKVENTGDEDVEVEDKNKNVMDVVMEGPRVTTKTSVTMLNIPRMKVKTEQPSISWMAALSAHSSLSAISTPSDIIDDQYCHDPTINSANGRVQYTNADLPAEVHKNTRNTNLLCGFLASWPLASQLQITAITLMSNFFAENNNTGIQELCEELLDGFTFMGEDLNTTDFNKGYHSKFILQLLATVHLQSCSSCPSIPKLKTDALKQYSIVGALSMCAAALECAIKLIGDGHVNIKNQISAKGKPMVKTPLKLNEVSGKESVNALAFSESNWGSSARSYCTAISKHGIDVIEETTTMARALLKTSA